MMTNSQEPLSKTALYQIGIKNVKEAASTDEAMEILEAVSIDLIFSRPDNAGKNQGIDLPLT